MVSTRADLLHDPEVRVELLLDQLLRGQLALVLLALPVVRNASSEVVVVGLDRRPALGDLGKPSAPSSRPAGLVRPSVALRVRRLPLIAHVDGRGRALEDEELAGDLGQLGDRLHCRGAGADDPDALSMEIDVVVPPRGVERVARERLHAVDPRQLWGGQDAVGEDHEARPHRVSAVGEHRPAAGRLVPFGPVDRGVEQTALVEPEPLGHRLAVLVDLEPGRELHRRDVAHLLQQREVAVGLDVTRDAGIPVPVPRAADVPALLAEPDIVEARFRELVPEQQAGEPRTDDKNLTLVGQRLPRHRVRRVDVAQVLRELALHRDVVGRAPPRLLVGPILGLFDGVEHRTGGLLRQHLQRLVRQHPVPGPGDVPVRRRSRVEHLQAARGIDTHCGSLFIHQLTTIRGIGLTVRGP